MEVSVWIQFSLLDNFDLVKHAPLSIMYGRKEKKKSNKRGTPPTKDRKPIKV